MEKLQTQISKMVRDGDFLYIQLMYQYDTISVGHNLHCSKFLIVSEDEAKALGSQGPNEGEAIALSAEKVNDAAKAGLSAAAMKAKHFAEYEEREIQRLCVNIITQQVLMFLDFSIFFVLYFFSPLPTF